MNNETIRLKNGSEGFAPLVAAIMVSLDELFTKRPIEAYEATMKARDANHKLWGNSAKVLRDYALIDDNGTMHESVANVIRSAVVGNGLDMRLVSPLAA